MQNTDDRKVRWAKHYSTRGGPNGVSLRSRWRRRESRSILTLSVRRMSRTRGLTIPIGRRSSLLSTSLIGHDPNRRFPGQSRTVDRSSDFASGRPRPALPRAQVWRPGMNHTNRKIDDQKSFLLPQLKRRDELASDIALGTTDIARRHQSAMVALSLLQHTSTAGTLMPNR